MPERRPNIILFLTDDHGPWTLPAYGNTECRAPTFDRLCAQGTRFANAFTPTPVCSPARACLLTGKIASQHGVHDWIDQTRPEYEDRDWLRDEITLAELLSRSGYVCGHSGKMHLGQSERMPRGYHYAFGIPGFISVHNGPVTYMLHDRPLPLNGNQTAHITRYALDFMRKARERPFLLTVGYTATHGPYVGHLPERVNAYKDATFRDIPAYEPHPWRFNEAFPKDRKHTEADVRIRHQNQYAAVTEIDEGVGQITRLLEELDLTADTLIVYTSDHGLSLGHAGFFGKGNGTRPLNMYEISIRVPLILYGPGRVPAGRVVEECVDHLDTFQYLCEAAGVDFAALRRDTSSYPGRSLQPLVAGESPAEWTNTRYGEYGDLRMIRTPEFKLVRRYPHGPDDLFALRDDPREQTNLAEAPEHAVIRAELEREMNAYFARYEVLERSGLRVKELPAHNPGVEAWRDGRREARGCQLADPKS